MSKILVIEDDADLSKVIVQRLSRYGFEAIAAREGCQGIELAHREKPDLILLDLVLPTGDGLFVLKNLRMASETAYIPVIVLTGQEDETYREKVMEAGVDAYLEKPYNPDMLVSTIQSLLEGSRRGGG